MTRQQAIDAKCKDCIYDPQCGGGTWREQVAQCSSPNCALWPYRPSPRGGRFANPPRDPEAVTPEWLRAGMGAAFSALYQPKQSSEVAGQPLRPDAATDRVCSLTAEVSEP